MHKFCQCNLLLRRFRSRIIFQLSFSFLFKSTEIINTWLSSSPYQLLYGRKQLSATSTRKWKKQYFRFQMLLTFCRVIKVVLFFMPQACRKSFARIANYFPLPKLSSSIFLSFLFSKEDRDLYHNIRQKYFV